LNKYFGEDHAHRDVSIHRASLLRFLLALPSRLRAAG